MGRKSHKLRLTHPDTVHIGSKCHNESRRRAEYIVLTDTVLFVPTGRNLERPSM